MNRTYNLLTLISCLLLSSVTLQAQELKIGYVKVEKIFAEWPETRKANDQLQVHEQKLNSRLQSKLQDFQKKAADYSANGATMDAVTRQDVETELQNLQTQIQQFEANAQQSVAQKNNELLAPLQDKLKTTIDTVAKAGGYTHILTYGSSLVYTSDEQGDISGEVAEALGFTLTP